MLTLLCGADRLATSAALLCAVCARAEAGKGGNILIVPEQYSHETERALCARGGDTISRYAEVLSFTRLAARVFSVCGGVCEEYLDENGRVLTLYLAAQQVREQLKFYAAVMTRPDFLRQLGTLMEELLTSCIPPDALHAAAARPAVQAAPGSTAGRAHDEFRNPHRADEGDFAAQFGSVPLPVRPPAEFGLYTPRILHYNAIIINRREWPWGRLLYRSRRLPP